MVKGGGIGSVVSDQRQRTVLPDVDLSGPASFEDFVGEQTPRVFGALRLIAGSRAEAEDALLEAFMQIWDRWDRVRASDDAAGEIFRTAVAVYQKRLTDEEPIHRRPPSTTPDPIVELEATDEMLVALDPFGYPSKDVGDLLGIGAKQVRTLASHGRAQLRRHLGEPHV